MDIQKRLQEHLEETLSKLPQGQDWFVICLQGSQNYGIADEESDIDSKLLLVPSLQEVALNKKPASHTYIMDNDEHCDAKDVREYFKIFRKSNINFVEILFTDYWIANEKYLDLWLELRERAEELARYNPYAAVSCMKGMAAEKLHALCHEYPSRMHVIEKYGYDAKQLSHLVRIRYFLDAYIAGEPYADCIYPKDEEIRYRLLELKRNGLHLTKHCAESLANDVFDYIKGKADTFRQFNADNPDQELDEFLNDIVLRLLERSWKEE